MAELKVLSKVINDRLETADLLQSLSPRRHRRSEREPDAFEIPGGENAGGKVRGDAERLEVVGQMSLRTPCVQTRHRTDARIAERCDDCLQVFRRDANVAVADDEEVVTG